MGSLLTAFRSLRPGLISGSAGAHGAIRGVHSAGHRTAGPSGGKRRNGAVQKLTAQRIDMRATRPSRHEVALLDPALADDALRFMASARLRRYGLMKALKDGAQNLDLRSFSADPRPALGDREKKIRAYVLELQNSANADERKKLEADFAELSDKALLNDLMPIVQEEIDRLKNIHFLSQCLADTTTNAITKIGNDIADTVITPQLRDRFQQEIESGG
jgi:hypothetical protein